MRYACLIYYDPKTLFNQSPESNAVLAECSTYGDKLIVGPSLNRRRRRLLQAESPTLQRPPPRPNS